MVRTDVIGTAPTGPGLPVWLEGLNEQQRQAVDHDGGPLLILAGAGTGKTKTLVCRLARLLANGTAPERILLVTFSRRAAEEMVRRVGALTDPAIARRVQAGTFHAMAHQLLRRYGAVVGLGDGFSLIDQADAAELMALVRTEAGTATDGPEPLRRRRFPRADTLVSIYSRVVNAQMPLETVLRSTFPWCIDELDGIRRVFTAYTDRKRAGHLIDFDDLLLYWRAAVGDPGVGPVLAASYDHVLVDEYQDTNGLQAEILRGLRGSDDRLTVVGDDAQAIYSFRAATVRNLIDFPQQFGGASTVTLEQNYRSNQAILDLANAVAADMHAGLSKSLWTAAPGGLRPVLATCPGEGAQADAVCDVVIEHLERGIRLRDQAVLFRAAHHSDLLELELGRRRIPFVKYGGLRFLEAAHVRDLVAMLRVLDNPWDELAWHRVLLLVEGVGPATSCRILADLGLRPRRADGVDPLARFVRTDRPVVARAEPSMSGIVAALTDCRSDRLDPGAEVDRLRQALDPLIRRRYDRGEVRMRDLDRLARLASPVTSRSALIAELTLDPPAATGDFAGEPNLDDDYLVLSTVHSSKGGEWRSVHVIHAADGMFPSDMATGTPDGVDEERRLFYVALTRAKEHLHIYAPLRYHHAGTHGWGDRHGYAQRTRFLPPSVDHLVDHRAVRDAGPELAIGDVTPTDLPEKVDGALRALW